MRNVLLNGVVIGHWDREGRYHLRTGAYPYGAPLDCFLGGMPTRRERKALGRLFGRSAACGAPDTFHLPMPSEARP